jgi:hypothetical protein
MHLEHVTPISVSPGGSMGTTQSGNSSVTNNLHVGMVLLPENLDYDPVLDEQLS